MIPNPLVDAISQETADGRSIDLSTHVAGRGFTRVRMTEDRTPGFGIVWRFLTAPDGFSTTGLREDEARILWLFGLLLGPEDQPCPFVCNASPVDGGYARHGVALLPELVTPAAVRALSAHYRKGVANGAFTRSDSQADRHHVHNDPAGRIALRALRGTVERIVGSPVKGSYSYASLYCGGTELPMHVDRPQCRYTLSLQIDHQPLPPDGRSPWPVQVRLAPDGPPAEYFQTIGGGILFRGCEFVHGRPPLPPDQESWVLLLHYVDADFAGPLD